MPGLDIGVIGPTGFGGSYLTVELLNRGHRVRGISRHPEKLGHHEAYTSHPIDLEKAPIEDISKAFSGLDVLVNEYGPHTAGEEALQYQPFLELTRKIILAAKDSKVGYFIMVGGCGSLNLPGTHFHTCSESRDWWLAYRRAIAKSHAHVAYMEERLGSMGTALREYRDAWAAVRQGTDTGATRRSIDEYEQKVLNNDNAKTFVTACRTSFMFFDGNTSFRWTYISPSALYRPGKRTGTYKTIFDEIPLKPVPAGADPKSLEDRLHGITAADLAIAITDEAEKQGRIGRHWSAYADLSDDTPTPSYVTLS
ncbi:hypothetical protein SEUCBS139899_010591 [Sporothrix eucalyptigena]